jgi:two-component system cell cycle response regulator
VKILLVEDEVITRHFLERTLEKWGYEVFSAKDGEEAWALLTQKRVRMVLTDWEMPRLSGPELCGRIRRQMTEYVYVLMLTAHKEPKAVVRGLEAGADDYISKPANPEELRARLGVGRRLLSLQDALASKMRELERANAQLQRIAATDPLMGVGNRRAFEERIGDEHVAASRAQRGYGVIMIDIDHFKKVNDKFGHLVGDRVLSQVAQTLRNTIEGEGEIFRYGGEEIACLVPVQTERELEMLAEKLRTAVAAMRVECSAEGQLLTCTASFGLSSFDPRDATRNVAWKQLVERADAALYRSKDDGRNCVTLFDPLAQVA